VCVCVCVTQQLTEVTDASVFFVVRQQTSSDLSSEHVGALSEH